jgi:hypothetical protein
VLLPEIAHIPRGRARQCANCGTIYRDSENHIRAWYAANRPVSQTEARVLIRTDVWWAGYASLYHPGEVVRTSDDTRQQNVWSCCGKPGIIHWRTGPRGCTLKVRPSFCTAAAVVSLPQPVLRAFSLQGQHVPTGKSFSTVRDPEKFIFF